ncbi:vesicle-associated membrane protein 2-like [Tiliqua scincoides]|uniref:vesicle-associated membrane protein 2-like n=1 Tax=Tiliqua scincoides TaxID=71010 RepID=UPI003461B918
MSDPAQPPLPGARTDEGQNGAGPTESSPNLTSNRRLQQTQGQVDEVVEIFHGNMEKILKRDQDLSQLDQQAQSLHDSAQQFETQTTALARKYWWKNAKMMIILGVICAIVAIAIARRSFFIGC